MLGEESFERLVSLDLGDLIGVDGTAFKSRRGELTLALTGWQLLAKSLRAPPEKFHGLEDVETRYRQRELDLIANEEVARAVHPALARSSRAIRRWLDDHGFLEVETPVLQPLYGGALARPFITHHNALDRDFYLRIATELYLKRLIVGGLEKVYEIGKDFRNEGISHKHNPEFTMLEWYEAYADYNDVARELEELVAFVAERGRLRGRAGLHPAVAAADAARGDQGQDRRRRAREPRQRRPRGGREGRRHRADPDETLAAARGRAAVEVRGARARPAHLHRRLSRRALAVREGPSRDGRPGRALGGVRLGIEFSNAFTELNDPDEQRARFEARRAHRGGRPGDPALRRGLRPRPRARHASHRRGGVGIDRLVMILSGRTSIREVILFPAMRGG